MTTGGNLLVGELTQTLLPVVLGQLSVLESPKMRVAGESSSEIVQGNSEEEEMAEAESEVKLNEKRD